MAGVLDSMFGLLGGGGSGWLFSNYTFSSFNVIFFWLTWSTLVLSHSPLQVSVVATAIIRLLFFWIPAVLFLAFDSAFPNLASSLKLDPLSLDRLSSTIVPILIRSALNQVLGLALHAALTAALPFPLFRITTTLPMLPTLIYDVFLTFMVQEVFIYYIHRTLHSRFPSIHAQHHSYSPIALLAYASHPVDYVLLTLLPIYVTPIIRRSHILTFFVIIAMQSIMDALRFSGYEGLWGPAGGLSRRLVGHYQSEGKVYYGLWGILDYLHGTSPVASMQADVKRAASKAKSVKSGVATKTEGLRRSTRKKTAR